VSSQSPIESSDADVLARFVAGLGESFWARWEVPYRHMGATITDATLLAGLNYKSVVEPRVRAIRANYPDARTTSAFIDLADSIPLSTILNWTHPEKLHRVRTLLTFFQREKIETEADLAEWIDLPGSRPQMLKLRGIEPKTFDYYRILAGLKTFAIDRHLFAFLRLAGYSIDDYAIAQDLLTRTAIRMGRDASEVDHSIWKFMSERNGGASDGRSGDDGSCRTTRLKVNS